ncbi:DUF4214 domain-containing protein [Paraburkholderia phymatum]|uniref:beta strand repeat-containing protein n=1 Tax=Paraburkholderia phymatum TaxID=148447 RepID=UPI003175682A
MAAAQYYEQIQQAYIAYYGRPADPAGQDYWATQLDKAGGNINVIINAFGNSTESTALYAGSNTQAQVNAIYHTLFGRDADVAGLNFYVQGINNGTFSLASVALNIYNGATGTDATELAAKLTYADAFTSQVSQSTAAQVAYSGTAASNNARAAVAGVTDTASATAAAANLSTTVAHIGDGTVGQTVTLTTGVDNVTVSGNGVVNATNTATSQVLGGLDVIKGTGTGNVLNIADTAAGTAAAPAFTLPTGISISGIQTDNITTNGALGGATAFDLSGQAGLTTANLVAADANLTNAANVKVADTTALNLTVTAGDVTKIVGGTAVTLNNGASADINGAGLTSVTANKTAGAVVVNNGSVTAASAAAADGKGTTLTSVTLNGTAAGASLTGNGLTNVTVENLTAAQTVTVNNATVGGHTLNLTASNAGYDATGVAAAVTIADANATAVTLAATGKDDVVLNAANAKSLTVTGSGAVVADLTGFGTATTLAKIDLSGNSGGVTLTDSAASAVLTGGSGNDVITLKAALTSASGGSINLGAGNNTLLVGAGGSIGSGVTVDGGVGGTNTISASLVNAGNAAGIKDFQVLDVSGFGSGAGNGSLDASLMTGSIISGVSISSATTNGVATLLNLGDNVTVTDTVDALAAVGTNDLVLSHASGTGTLTVNFADALKAHTNGVNIDSLTSTGDTSIVLSSAGVKGAVNSLTALTETDNHLTTVTITGSNQFTLGGVTTAVNNASMPQSGTTASSLTTIDGSAATGALHITAGANSGAGDNVVSYAGLTIKGGIGGDTIINHAANGVIVEGATASTLFNTLTIDGKGASINDAASAGADVLNLGGVNNSATLGSGTGVTVAVSNVAGTHSIADSVTFGSGTANVTDGLLYQASASATSANTNGNVLTLNGALHGETLSFATVTNAVGALGAATSVAAAQTFDQAVFAAHGAANTVTWFQYAGNTYVESNGAAADASDSAVVKIAGVVDLSHAAVTAGGHITFA